MCGMRVYNKNGLILLTAKQSGTKGLFKKKKAKVHKQIKLLYRNKKKSDKRERLYF